jgi:rhodanese-related sulfurtransferase
MKLSLNIVLAGMLIVGTLILATLGDPGPEQILARRGAEFQGRLDRGEVQIDPAELLDLMHDRTVRLRVVDIRPEAAWNWFHLVDAEHLSGPALRTWGSGLDFDEIVIVIDQDGQSSPEAWRLLQAREISSSYLLDGGIDAWMERFGDGFQPASALGDRHPAALPDAHHGFEYSSRVKRLGKAPVLSGGCG